MQSFSNGQKLVLLVSSKKNEQRNFIRNNLNLFNN